MQIYKIEERMRQTVWYGLVYVV